MNGTRFINHTRSVNVAVIVPHRKNFERAAVNHHIEVGGLGIVHITHAPHGSRRAVVHEDARLCCGLCCGDNGSCRSEGDWNGFLGVSRCVDLGRARDGFQVMIDEIHHSVFVEMDRELTLNHGQSGIYLLIGDMSSGQAFDFAEGAQFT